MIIIALMSSVEKFLLIEETEQVVLSSRVIEGPR